LAVIEDVLSQVEARLRELEPLVDEHERLTRVVEQLKAEKSSHTTHSRSRVSGRKPARPRARARRRRRVSRSDQALELVASRPGITVREMSNEMGIEPNYLYRVLPNLAKEGKVRRKGEGWAPATAKKSK
jgi:predicted HTH transcriptional regulator